MKQLVEFQPVFIEGKGVYLETPINRNAGADFYTINRTNES